MSFDDILLDMNIPFHIFVSDKNEVYGVCMYRG